MDREGAAGVEKSQRRFAELYGSGPGAPVAVLIPAFNESTTVADVVRSVPAQIDGLDVEAIVLDDGSTDGTAEEAAGAGALVCRLPVNVGQGNAFRVGYRIAVDRQARFIATVDADGQFDGAELPALFAPLLSGDADFVNGSRRLGRAQTTDPVRRAGVVLFGGLVSILTRSRITDPANGMRAFRSEVVSRVSLHQAQYQTSELLIGAIAQGFRVREVPVTVYPRRAGETKKGSNAVYAIRFAQVVVTTWWRQRRAFLTAGAPRRP